MKIRLTRPFIPKYTFRRINLVLKSGWLTQGKNVKKFEKLLAEFLRVKYAVAVSSGTAALHLSLMAIGIKPNDEVIVPALTFPATANVVEIIGARVVLVDVDTATFNIDPSKIEKRITSKTKAIIPVHLCGQSADMDPILRIAKKHKLIVIEDAACALGAEYKGKKCGTIGDLSCFSFHPRKIITTGEGGVVVTNNRTLAQKIKSLRDHGIEVINNQKKFVQPGLNNRMTEIQALLGIAQLKNIEKRIQKNIEKAKIYNNLLKNVKEITTPICRQNNKHIYQTYGIILDDCLDRDKIIEELKKVGIETTLISYALHVQPYFREKYKFKEQDFPHAFRIFKQGLAIPLYFNLSKKEIFYIVNNLKKVINRNKRL
jgi:perosamine synthetase